MEGIYIAAIITSVVALGIIGIPVFWKTPREDWLRGLLIILLELPMSAVAFYLIRKPLDGLISNLVPSSAAGYQFLTTAYAPLTEEPIKLWVLLFPWIFRRITPKNGIQIALIIGLGFGIGELWMLAQQFAQDPSIAGLPWYHLGGYIQERFLVCIFHGAFTAAALYFFRKKFFILGLLLGMLLHYLGNFPIFLARSNVGGFGGETWKIILLIWVQFYFLAMLGFIALLLIRGNRRKKSIDEKEVSPSL
jgi:hypothetical protein